VDEEADTRVRGATAPANAGGTDMTITAMKQALEALENKIDLCV
jgi:hypothetical protein